VGLILSLTTLLVVICFMRMFGWSHYIMALVSVACALLAAGMTAITYKFIKLPEKGYRKQFD